MSTELIHQVRVSPEIDSRMIDMSHNGVVTPGGLSDTKTTLQSLQKKDCCDYVVPQEKQPNCWKKLSPCQKKLICCGGILALGGGIGGALYGTGTLSGIGSIGAGGAALACCLVPFAIIGVIVCYKCCKGDENNR